MSSAKDQLPEYQQFAWLAGRKLGIAEAARKYSIPHPTISRWVRRGLIAVLDRDGQKVLINEQDIAYCAYIYHNNGGGVQGRRLFSSNGTPYEPKTR